MVENFNPATKGATLTLKYAAEKINSIQGLLGAATAVANTTATVGTSAPTGTDAKFTGTAESPSNQVVLGSSWTANSLVAVDYEVAGQQTPDK